MPRPRALAALAAAFLAAAAPALPATAGASRVPMAGVLKAAPSIGDMSIGSPDAPVTVVEYTSTLCPFCGRFRRDTWPAIKAGYVDTGKVRWIVREFTIGNADYAGFLLARCEGNEAAPAVIDTMFGRQRDLGQANASSAAFVTFAGLMGISREKVVACVSRSDIREALDAERRAAVDDLGVDGTPTFFVNGQRLVGEVGEGEMSNVLDRAAAAVR